MTTEVYNQENKVVGKIDLPENVFNAKWRPTLVQQVLVAQLANVRKPLAHVKTRGEVRGGGVTHGPRKDRDFSKKINKKMKRLALYSTLSKKTHDKELFVIDNLKLEKPKTSGAAKIFGNFFKKPGATLLIAEKGNRNIFLAARNIPKTTIANPESLNVYDCLAAKNILVEKGAVEAFAK
ncbi:MAG: 50S ribosomal protein L4 [Candidatus Jorgensenbacteria bacterium GW2011_GWA1_48_11]|uniref:Large ribosomal subunit protein uL4 n=1 Tax=Candidatus Jorgensenbacteria bacterium GW2011_GWA1_48_11 TaxID=1618660 RepID=A0A0G1U9R6_9BACT|nr:MAG: 50S ribosomal protein L4 [Candidatus Jorgensenbacteria bacterium GW2011_GWA1_48_11]